MCVSRARERDQPWAPGRGSRSRGWLDGLDSLQLPAPSLGCHTDLHPGTTGWEGRGPLGSLAPSAWVAAAREVCRLCAQSCSAACEDGKQHPRGRAGCPGKEGAQGGCSEELSLPGNKTWCSLSVCTPGSSPAPRMASDVCDSRAVTAAGRRCPCRSCSCASCERCNRVGEGDSDPHQGGPSQRARPRDAQGTSPTPVWATHG